MSRIKILKKNNYSTNEISVCCLRYEDIMPIRDWRNSQIKFLRQTKNITKIEQENYYKNVVTKEHSKVNPDQILFSILKKSVCIGYGGLVHIDWDNKNSEISFLLKPELNGNKDSYSKYFCEFLNLIEKISKEIGLHKIYTFGFDIEEFRFSPLKKKNFLLEVKLKKHVLIEKKLKDILVYSKIL